MKTIVATICLLLILLLPNIAKAAFVETKTESSRNIITGNQAELLNHLKALANLNRKEYEKLTGEHLNLAERILFGINRRHLQKELQTYQASGVLPEQTLSKLLSPQKGRDGRNVLLIVIIVLLALLIIPLALIGKWN